jgi:hypothetical protein
MTIQTAIFICKERENTLLKIDILSGGKNLPVFKPEP